MLQVRVTVRCEYRGLPGLGLYSNVKQTGKKMQVYRQGDTKKGGSRISHFPDAIIQAFLRAFQ